jgi:hypothetical protein
MSYPINAPIDFVNTNGTTDTLNFNADGPTANAINKVENFVVSAVGDILYRSTGVPNYLERLPIGTAGQILTVTGGIPSWATQVSPGQNTFAAYVTASIAGIPTSRTGGASPGTWFVLNNTYVTWSEAAPGNDPDGVFTPATGIFTAPAAGYYAFDAVITFDSGVGVTAGSGLPAAPLPSGAAVRQAQIFSPTLGGGTALATVTRQVEGSNSNCTAISISMTSVLLAAADTVQIRVRHDRTAANTVTIGNVAISIPSQTYFTGRRIR